MQKNSTGFVRERIEHSKVFDLQPGLAGQLWDNVLSHCPFVANIKNVFFNQFVIEKGSYVSNHRMFWYWPDRSVWIIEQSILNKKYCSLEQI